MVNYFKLADALKENIKISMANLKSDLLKVNSLMFRCLILISLMTSAFAIMAETTLTASVDRNKIYESDTLNLIIMGEIEMDFSLGGIMNFGRNQLEAPNTDALSKDFEILDQKQSYNMQSINGDTTAQVTWSYSLAPKRTGSLKIPTIKYKDAASNELTIRVMKGKAPQDANNPPQVFIEATIDKSEAYIQEQIVYTLRLYSADRLASGELSVPESNDAIIEALGDTKKYFRMAYNRRYEVRERQYLIFPQKSGKLTIDAQSFNGLLIDTNNRRRVRVRELSEPMNIDIKSPPASFTGDTWLPATSLYLSEKWATDPDNLMVGDSITRTLEIKALGLLGSALPPMGLEKVRGLKIYPDSPTVESQQHESGAQSIRQESIALVAVSPNEVTLPEIRIPWWDTLNDVERVAVIPAHTFNITVNPEIEALVQIPQVTSEPVNRPNPDQSIPEPARTNTTVIEAPNNQLWYTIIVLILLAWISTTLLLIKRRVPENSNLDSTFNAEPELTLLYKNLCEAIKQDDHEMPKHLIIWASKFARFNKLDLAIQSLHDLVGLNESIYAQAKAFEAQLYAGKNTEPQIQYDQALLLQQLKALVKESNHTPNTSALRPMYP